jgi:putative ABC transport system substrate-binding protein
VTGAEAAARVDRIFRQALREGGHEDGRSIRLLQYSAEGEMGRLPTVAARIVTDRPAVVVAMGPAAARAIKEATSSIAIVALTSSPVELGLASSLARPGGNLTGVSLVTTDLDAKRLSLLSEFVPAARRMAILADPAVASPEHMALVEAAARQLGITPDLIQAATPRDIEPALRSARERGAGAVNVLACRC